MDAPGYFYGQDPTQQAQQQMMARLLMSNQQGGQQSAVAGAGQNIVNAVMARNAMNQAQDKQQGFPSQVAVTPQKTGYGSAVDWANQGLSKMGGLFNLGGGG